MTVKYPTLKELVEEFIRHYGNTPEEEKEDFDLDDAIHNIVSLWNDEFEDDPYWIIDPDGELRSIGCDGFDECREEVLEHFDYEFPNIERLIKEFQLEGVVP